MRRISTCKLFMTLRLVVVNQEHPTLFLCLADILWLLYAEIMLALSTTFYKEELKEKDLEKQ